MVPSAEAGLGVVISEHAFELGGRPMGFCHKGKWYLC